MSEPAADPLVLGAAPGIELHLLATGATVQRLLVPGGDGVRRDVVLGLPDGDAVRAGSAYVGSIVGRYANRVAHGRFTLDGAEHELPVNDRGHHLHGGPDGFHTREWRVVQHDDDAVELELVSPDGDAGYPGELRVRARYEVGEDVVVLTLSATADAPTIVNLTGHSYWNLAGTLDTSAHVLRVPAATYRPVDDAGIPVAGPTPVDGTAFDLRAPRRLEELAFLDHHLDVGETDTVVDGTLRLLAELDEPTTGTRLQVWSDQPGLQVYAGEAFDGSERDVRGRPLVSGCGVALEPQLPPDSPNHEGEPGWPSAVLRPGETYRTRTEWRFAAIGAPTR